jgi:hypothetical protein
VSAAVSLYGGLGEDCAWWTKQNESRRAEIISDVTTRLWRDLEPMREMMLTAARLYGNLPTLGLSPRLYRQRQTGANRRRLSLNVIKSVVDTYTALICKDQPKMSFVTNGGDWSLQRRAKLLEKFVDGVNYEQELHMQAQQVVRDSALFGIGFVKLYADEDDEDDPHVAMERVLPWELLVDDQEACHGKPQSLHQVKFVDKRALMQEYPDHAADIMAAGAGTFMDFGEGFDGVNIVEWVAVIESWHLARTAKSGDGRHCISVGQALLEDDEWTERKFPFESLYRQRPLQGMWGQSLADELAPLQVEIARLLQLIQRSQMTAVGHWLVEENARINTNAINDVVGSIIRYTGAQPEFKAFQPVSNDVYAHLDRLWQRAFEVVGISPMAAQSQKPAGLNSGRAMLVYADVQSQRFQPSYREYQEFYRRMALQSIHLARQIDERHPGYRVKTTGKSMMKTVAWADANLKDEEFELKLLPTNKLADEPSARLEIVQGMMNSGMISPEDGRRLLEMPDLEAFESYENASYDNIMRAAEEICENGRYYGPEPYMNLADAIKRMQMCYLKARLDNVPEDRLELMRRWIDEAVALAQPPAPPPQLPPGGDQPPGPGAPMASDLANGPGIPAMTQHLVQKDIARDAAGALG